MPFFSKNCRRPRLVQFFSLLVAFTAAPARSESFSAVRSQPDDRYRVEIRGKLEGDLPRRAAAGSESGRVAVEGTSRLVYRERALRADSNGAVDRLLRIYDDVEYKRRLDGPEEVGRLRPQVRRIVVEGLGRDTTYYSPDGPLTWAELELVGGHARIGILEGFLPTNPVEVGETWRASPQAVAELVDLDAIESGAIECRYNGTIEHKGATYAQVAIEGTVVGRSKEGRSRNEVFGAVYLDAATHRLSSLRIVGKRQFLGAGKEVEGEVAVDYQLLVRRLDDDPDLGERVVAALPAGPDEGNTAIRYEHPKLDVQLTHPRFWVLTGVDGSDMLFAVGRNSLVVHRESEGRTPSTARYFEEVRQYLETKGFSTARTEPPTENVQGEERIGCFRFEGRLSDQELVLDYWVVGRGPDGVTIAARFRKEDAGRLAPGVRAIAKGITFEKR